MVTLFALFLRPVGFDYRSKIDDPRWRNAWDWGIFVNGLVPTLVFGVAFGNLLLGVPFRFDGDQRVFYTGSFVGLLNPFALVAGSSASPCWRCTAGSTSSCVPKARSRRARRFRPARWRRTARRVRGGRLLGRNGHRWLPDRFDAAGGIGVPALGKDRRAPARWLAGNYSRASVDRHRSARSGRRNDPRAHLFGALAGCARIRPVLHRGDGDRADCGFALFPFIIPSSSDPAHSLTVWDSVSSYKTLQVMFWAVPIFVPIILLYTAWVIG